MAFSFNALKNKPALLWGVGTAVVVAIIISAAWWFLRPSLGFGIDPSTAPNFVTANIVDVTKYGGISKFRSGVGTDFSGGGETCRSMKHIFLPIETTGSTGDANTFPQTIPEEGNLPVFAPFDGEVTAVQSQPNNLGKELYLRPTSQESYTLRILHVFPGSTIATGTKITAGERIGSVLPWQQLDVAVQILTLSGPQFISYFDVLADSAAVAYDDRGANPPDDFVINRQFRDDHPLTCNGNAFTEKDSFTGDNWYFFSDYTPPAQG